MLIDFGRGETEDVRNVMEDKDRFTWESSAVMFARPDDVRSQDIYDYGCLLMDLVQQWMAATSQSTLPPFLVDIITRCICEGLQPMMREIVDIWERWVCLKVSGAPQPDFINGTDAWETLSLSTKSRCSATRSMPSVRHRKYGNISVERLD